VYRPRPTQASHANIFAFDISVVRWNARRGLRDSAEAAPQRRGHRNEKFEQKEKAHRRDLLGETYGY
jgi:hypothetical protein